MLFAIVAIVAIVMVLVAFRRDNEIEIKREKVNELELARAMTYNPVTDDDAKIEGCDYVQFNAFFTRDLNNDGYAEKYDGTCNRIGNRALLYFDINVLTDGKLQNGKIEINGKNFTLSTSLVKDVVLKNNYVSSNTKLIELNDISNGTQKLFSGSISANIGNNIKNYSVENNTVTLTGTWVPLDGSESKEIKKVITLKTDWYSTTNTSVSSVNTSHNIADAIKEDCVNLSFNIGYSETNGGLILQKQITEVTIPDFNGYAPIEAPIVTSQNCKWSYNESSRLLTIERDATVIESGEQEGRVTSTISRDNTYAIQVKYPLEAYQNLTGETISVTFPTRGEYWGYNNNSDEFKTDNPSKSEASRSITHTWRKPSGKVARFDVSVGKVGSVISKELPLNIYNNLGQDEDSIDDYTVRWDVFTGDMYTDQNGIYMSETQGDKFLDSKGIYSSMKEYMNTAGIYFSGLSGFLEDDGWVKVYNAETNELLVTFTKEKTEGTESWKNVNSSNPYYFDDILDSIKIETSKGKNNSSLSVYQIKEIDDDKLTRNYKKDEFLNLNYVYSYLQGGLVRESVGKQDFPTDQARASYEEPKTGALFSVSPSSITNQNSTNVSMTIKTDGAGFNRKKWKNGRFLIELPEEILDVIIKNIRISNENVEISSYEVYEDNGKQYISIYTSNDEPEEFSININIEVTADPRKPTMQKYLYMYATNENCSNYTSSKEDILDINGNGNTSELVLYSSDWIKINAPSSLFTIQTLSNFDDTGAEIVSPKVAILDKTSGERNARINLAVTNNYSGTISEVKIVGKIPFEGNTYQLNSGNLGSTYSVTMDRNGINLPDKLKNVANVYYSFKETVTNDKNDSNNGWRLASEINANEWSQVKTYLIDLNGYSLSRSEVLDFYYDIVVPENVKINNTTYSTHAIYFCLDTVDGKLKTQTEVNRLGITIARKYSVEVTKYQKNTNKKVGEAVYKLFEEGQEEGMTQITSTLENQLGELTFNKVYAGKTYILKEIATPSQYEINNNEIKFRVYENGTGELEAELLSLPETLRKNTNLVLKNMESGYVLEIQVEDEVRPNLKITKVDQKDQTKLQDVKYRLTGKGYEKGRILKTDENGEVSLVGLYVNEEYLLEELEAEGYYLASPIKFKIVNNSGVYTVETIEGLIANSSAEIVDYMPTMNLKLEDEKIPTYSIEITKIKKDEDPVQTLDGALYEVYSEYTQREKYCTTIEGGKGNISGLYNYVEGKNEIIGKYILREMEAPEGFVVSGEDISFKVALKDGNMSVFIENESNLKSLVSYSVEGNVVKLVLQDSPVFTVRKIDAETKEPIANVKFIVQKVDINKEFIDYAKDESGNYIGEKDENGRYIITTDSNGKYTAGLESGKYKVLEIEAPEKYYLSENEEERATYFAVNSVEDVRINYIEDLMEVIESDSDYSGEIVSLMRTLNFDDPTSYRDVKNMTKLTKGKSNAFNGIFLGNGKEIQNISINNENENENVRYLSLFSTLGEDGKIIGLGVTGEILHYQRVNSYVSGIVGINDGTITNCYNKVNINIITYNNITSYTGGIAGSNYGGKITNCYNAGNINGYYSVGGITGSGGTITNCYNTGTVTGEDEVGGISGGDAAITNCYNVGDIMGGDFVGGIIGKIFRSTITKCYNAGNITGTSDYIGGAAGIAGYVDDATITNCYNTGTIVGVKQVGGIAGYDRINVAAINCYNTGNITGTEEYVAGIVSGGGTVKNCYNTGEITGTKYVGGMMGYGYVSTSQYLSHCDEAINCYNAGTIKGKESVGGIAGNGGKLTNCYYLKGTATKGVGKETDSAIVKTDSEMQSESFLNQLNVNKNNLNDATLLTWIKGNKYPTLDIAIEEIDLGNIPKYDSGFVVETELEIENTIKRFKVTTEVDANSDGERTGGTITGTPTAEPNINFVEEVSYGYPSQKKIVITPSANYTVYSIKINDEIYEFMPDSNGTVTIPVFEDVKQDYHIKVVFEKNMSSVIVHHYIKDAVDAIGSPVRVPVQDKNTGNIIEAKDEYYKDKIGAKYTTNARFDTVGYKCVSVEGESSGKFEEGQKVVIYYYEQEIKFNLTVHHYLEGTEDKLEEDDVTNELDRGTKYTATPNADVLTRGYDLVPELTTVNLDESKYTKEETNNITGNIEKDTEVTYYYRLKEYNITTKVNPITVKKFNEITNEYEDITVKGGVISGENETPYETVIRGEDSTKDIIITPDEGYRIKSITVKGGEDESGVNVEFTINHEDGKSVVLDKFTNVTEDKEVIVEFEPILGKLVVNHFIEGTTEPVPLSDGTTAKPNERERYVGDPYATKQLENLAENWEFVRVEGEPGGKYIDGTVTITYYYTEIKISGTKSWTANVDRIILNADGEKVKYVQEGDTITYIITARNDGKYDREVIVKDEAPVGTTFAGNIKIDDVEDNTKTEEDLAEGILVNVSAGGEVTLSFDVIVKPLSEGIFETEIRNTAVVNGKNTEPEVVIPVKKPNVIATKSSNPASRVKVADGDEIIYTIRLDNSKGTAPTKVRVKDSAPVGTSFVNGSIHIDGQPTYNLNGIEVDLTGVSEDYFRNTGIDVELGAGQIRNVSFKVIVTGKKIDETTGAEVDMKNDENIVNTAIVNKNPKDSGEPVDPKDEEETNSVEHTYVKPIIAAVKDWDSENKKKGNMYVEESETVTFTITVTNEGGLAKEVTVKDEIKEGMTFKAGSIKVNGVSQDDTLYEADTKTIDGIVVNVPAKDGNVNGTAVISFDVTVDELPEGMTSRVLKNQAVVDDEPWNEVEINVLKSNIKSTKVVEIVDEKGNKVENANGQSVKLGQELTYKIKVWNEGTLEGIATICDSAPINTEFVSESIQVDGKSVYTTNGEEVDLSTKDETYLTNGISLELPAKEEGKNAVERIVSFKVRVKKETVDGTKVENTATVNDTETNKTENLVVRPIIDVHKEIVDVMHMNGETEIEGLEDRKDYVFREDKITYNIKATNVGGAEGKVIIKDIISDKVELDIESIRVGGTIISGITSEKFANEGIEVTVPAKMADKAGEIIISFTVKVKGDASVADETEVVGDIVNQAKWNYKNPTEESNPENPDVPTEHETEEVKVPIVVIEKKTEIIRTTVENQKLPEDTVTAKDEIKYTIVVTNTGTLDIGELIVKDTEPEGTTIKDELVYHDKDLTNGEVTDNLETNQKEISWKINNISAKQEGKTGNDNIAERSFIVTVDYDEVESKKILNTAYVNDKPTNEVETPYKKPEPKMTTEIIKTGDETTMVENKVHYNIKYTGHINDFVGKANVTIVDELPYRIDKDKSELNGGKYEEDLENKKYTITWELPAEEINTYLKDAEHTITVEKEIWLSYTEELESSFTNKAVATTQLKEPNPEKPTEDKDVGDPGIAKDTHIVKVKTAYKLPETGRNGTTIFAFMGIMFIATGIGTGIVLNKRKNILNK